MDKKLYKFIHGDMLSNSPFCHHSVPRFNLTSMESIDGENSDRFCSYEEFGFDVGMTTVLHNGSGVRDVSAEFMTKKLHWVQTEKTLRPKNLKKALTELNQFKQKKRKKLSLKLLLYLRHVKHEIMPAFQGVYNWLYSGSNLNIVKIDEMIISISADNSCTSVLCISKLSDNCDTLVETKMHPLKMKQPILQITSLKQSDSVVVLVRQKNNVTILKLENNLAVTSTWKKKLSKEKFFTSCVLGEEAALVDNGGRINFFNVASGKLMRKQWIDISGSNGFSKIMFHGKNLILVDQKSIYEFDHQAPDDSIPSIVHTMSSQLEPCEVITDAWLSTRDSNSIYLALSHNLIEVDLRSGQTRRKWTHLMRNAPQFCNSINLDNEELIFLQSHKPDEIVGMIVKRRQDSENDVYVSLTAPLFLPSVLDSLKKAQYEGMCLDSRVSERFSFSVTGSQVIEGEHDIHLFTSNAAGDIFKATLEKNNDFKLTDLKFHVKNKLNTLKKAEKFWLENVFDKNKKLHVSDIVDMGHLVEQLKNPTTCRPYRTPDIHWKYHEMYAKESLKTYRDILAGKILQVWGIEQESDEEVIDSSYTADEKVKEWLKNHPS